MKMKNAYSYTKCIKMTTRLVKGLAVFGAIHATAYIGFGLAMTGTRYFGEKEVAPDGSIVYKWGNNTMTTSWNKWSNEPDTPGSD